jgi:hypothetical protein
MKSVPMIWTALVLRQTWKASFEMSACRPIVLKLFRNLKHKKTNRAVTLEWFHLANFCIVMLNICSTELSVCHTTQQQKDLSETYKLSCLTFLILRFLHRAL